MNAAALPSAAAALAQIGDAVNAGNAPGAMALAEAARLAFPGDAALADAAGDLAIKAGDARTALAHFAAACTAAPHNIDFAVNHAIALQQVGRHGEVIAALDRHETSGRRNARYASVRATSERARGHLTQAAHWYDIALSIDALRPRALHGRARVALESGEANAAARFERALAVTPGDAELWLGKAQALEVDGNAASARVIAEQIAQAAPSFLPGLTYLAGLRLSAGEADFAAPFRDAAARMPHDPNIAITHIETLAGLDQSAEAADVAADARSRFPHEPRFVLLEAIHTGAAGDFARAETIFSTLADDRPVRLLHEARHRLRGRDPAAADHLLTGALAAEPWDIAAWALRGLAWRLLDDSRAAWLHEQVGLVQLCPLAADPALLGKVATALRAIHATSPMPLGQSLRGGTQTRGILFHRREPVLAELHDAICTTLEEYRAALPPADAAHPLLRHRAARWQLAGSWSVRLTGGNGGGAGDYHTAHIHPQGAVSSALYLVVPDAAADHAHQRGWLEIGRPPVDLALDLPPLRVIQPQPGHLALFPSTLFHGTTPFGSAGHEASDAAGHTDHSERLTVAFDVVPNGDATP